MILFLDTQTNPQISNNDLFQKLNEVMEETKNIQSQINVLQGNNTIHNTIT